MYYVNAWIESRKGHYVQVRCVHHHPSVRDALHCRDAPPGAFLRYVSGEIERSLTPGEMAEVRHRRTREFNSSGE